MSNKKFTDRIGRRLRGKARLLVFATSFLSLLITLSFSYPYKSRAQQNVAESFSAEFPIVTKSNVDRTNARRASNSFRNAGQDLNVSPAATRTVDTIADNPSLTACTGAANDCSLRGAISGASPGDVINFDSTIFSAVQTITLTSGQLLINKNLTINGPGPDLLTISGNNISRIFSVSSGFTVTISGLTITKGRTSVEEDFGGGIFSLGNLTLTNCAVVNNQSGSGGGVTLGFGDGTFTNCTFNGNTAGTQGGAIFYEGDGGHTLRLINSTVSGNRANGMGNGGGIFNLSASGVSTLDVLSSTIANNTSAIASGGGGIMTAGSGGTATSTLRNSIIANNSAPNLRTATDSGGTANIVSQGYNLTTDNSSTFLNQSTDQINIDPLLAPLGNNGGPTQTQALLPGSPALDKGNSFGVNTDQRGLVRPFNITAIAPAAGGDNADIGAYEFQGQILTVNKIADTNDGSCDAADCSLREAIAAAAPGDGILFSSLFSTPQTIVLGGSELVINKNLTINGPGANLLTVSGNNASRVFNINPFFTVALSGMTISNGSPPGGQSGGGILNNGGLTLVACVISGNTATDTGAGAFGGGMLSTGNLAMINCTVANNNARNGAGLAIADGTITSCTLSGNTASNQAGGIDFEGSGGHLLRVVNSTVSGNTANGGGLGGGILNLSVSGASALEVVDSTIVNNSSSNPTNGGGIRTNAQNSGSSATTTLRNSIIANNTLPNLSIGATGGGTPTITSQGYNLASDNGNSFLNQPTDKINTDPLLAPLANNGGPTRTHALLTGSPALDAGESSGSNTDQRGFTRPVDMLGVPNALNGDGADIGAFEAQAPTPTPTPTPPTIQFSSPTYSVGEGDQQVSLTVTRSGNTSGTSSVSFATSDDAGSQNCNVFNGKASSRCDYIAAIGTLNFAAGETSKTISILIIDDSYAEGPETFNVSLSNPSGATLGSQATATVTIIDNDTTTGPNPIDQPGFFVRQHYFDFLNRVPDAPGLAFWTAQITSCGTDTACIDDKRNNVSASFFLSIEFQQTGYLVERMYKAAYGDATGSSIIGGAHQLPVPIVRFNEFLPDTQRIGQGVIVGQTGWEMVLENNKQAFASEFVQRSRFTSAFATTLTPAQFVDRLFLNAGVTPSATDRNAAIAEFGSATNTSDVGARGRAVRRVAENATLTANEFNRAFVLMQYFGYLRRNPNDAPEATLDHSGYEFWLNKLNFFNGDYIKAEMVKAFITSFEYRQRFGPSP